MNSGLGALSSSSTSRFHGASSTTTTTTTASSASNLQPASSSSTLRSRATRVSNGGTPSSSRPASVRSNVSRKSYHGSSTNNDGGSATSTTPSKAGSMKRSSSQRQNLLIPEGWEGGWSKLSNIANSVLNVDLLGIGTESGAWGLEVDGRDGGKDKDGSGSLRNRSKTRSGETNGSGRGEVYSRTKRRDYDTTDTDTGQWNRCANGSTKRATSPPPDQDSDQCNTVNSDAGKERLVYIHRVRPTDTFEGILITYSISAAALRKANRLWPGDSIQARRELLLPTDECYVRGQHLSPEEALPLLPPDPDITSSASSISGAPSSVSGLPSTEYPEPHAYLQLPSIPHPIPISRLSSSNLTYFPPHRPTPHPSHARTNSSISTTSLTTPPDTPTGIMPGKFVSGSFPLHAHIPDPNSSGLPNLNLNLNLHIPEFQFHKTEENIGKVLVVANEVGKLVEGFWRSAWGRDGEDNTRSGIELGSMNRGQGYNARVGDSRGGSENGGGGASNTSSRVGREGREGRRRRQRVEGKRD